MPAAKQGDFIKAMDQHQVNQAGTPPPPPVMLPHPFNGVINGSVSSNVKIMGKFAAVVGSTASNTPPHIPAGINFVKYPSNRGTIISGSGKVFINGKPAARSGDTATTCNDPVDVPVGKVVASGTVYIG